MRKVVWCWLGLAVSTVLLDGCGAPPDAAKEQREADAASAPALSPNARGARIEAVTCAEWDQALAAQRGQIVVVDTWATWCIPCVEEFPHLVDLHRKYTPEGIVCMSVSVDEPEAKEEALDFLQEQEAAFANYLIDDDEYAWFDKWEIKGIPVVLVFDRDGQLVRKFDKDDPDNQFTYADVEELVVDLLATK